VDVALGRDGDARTDRILLALAPFGVFRAIAWAFHLGAALRLRRLYAEG